MQRKVVLINSTKNNTKPMLRETHRAWFSRLLWLPAGKRSGSILCRAAWLSHCCVASMSENEPGNWQQICQSPEILSQFNVWNCPASPVQHVAAMPAQLPTIPRFDVPRTCSRVVRIDLLHFLAGCRKKRLNQALSVFSLSLGFFQCLLCC